MHTFVDDSTLSEIIGKDDLSQMETYFGDLLNCTALNLININITKTKEMIVGVNVNPPPQLIFNDEIIERVFDSICSKASSRLHFLTQLKRNGATVKDMVHFYETVIRSVLEYACPAWHSSLTVEQCFIIESIQDDHSSYFTVLHQTMKTYVKTIPICHYTIVESFYVNVSFIPLRTVKAA